MIYIKRILLLFVIAASFISAQNNYEQVQLVGTGNGSIPVWLVTGPIEFPLYGFGNAKDTTAIGEPFISPAEGEYAVSTLPEKEKTRWIQQSVNSKGFIDFNNSLSWNVNPSIPTKIWYARAGYAFTIIESVSDREAVLSLGSNSHLAVYLNGVRVHSFNDSRNAVPDQDKINIKLKKGKNDLLVRVLNTHKNLGIAFFGTLKWEWGFYARLLDKSGKPLLGIDYSVNVPKKQNDFNAYSTFYFKKLDGQLKQRVDFEINSFYAGLDKGSIKIKADGKNYDFKIDSVRYGITRHSFYIPEFTKDVNAEVELLLKSGNVKKTLLLKKQKKYNLHVMLLNHTDVGYTHPQPVCEELHCNTLDDVIKMCKEHPDFHWTIETTWQLEAYEKLRTPEKFNELMALVKSGRIAVSPVYTNPFTGYVSEEEMLRSFDKAAEYKKRYGLNYNGAVYNDVPGQAWFLPQALAKAGVKLVAEGINEVYGDYKLQRSLPKVFKWEAADGSRVVTYINEAYNEGKNFGLESGDLYCVEQTIWERINKLEAKNYDPDVVLINTSFSDNSILAAHQYHLSNKWNAEYEYPRFISSNIDLFTEALLKSSAYDKLPVLRGDWTSNWDIFYNGEFQRHSDARKIQHKLLTAEKLTSIVSLKNSSKLPLNIELADSYRSLLQFSGHGSGLEYGYGSPEDNKLTMDFRQNYIDAALLGAEEVTLKSLHQLTKPEESLESEAVFLFNSLSWTRNEVIELRYPFDHSPAYDIVDPETNKTIPSFRKGHKQYFVANSIPSMGYKKYMLKPSGTKNEFTSGLTSGSNFIENQFYKISIDQNNSVVTNIIDKKSGRELLNNKTSFPFAVPTEERYQLQQTHAPYEVKTSYQVIDESPVRMLLKIDREGDVFESVEYILADGIDKVFVNTTADLGKLQKTPYTVEYGLPFSFNLPGAKVKSEILGGFIDMEKDRLPGVDHDGVSLRRSVSIYNNNSSIKWTTADARVIRVRKDSLADVPVIISNPLNNFPESWNRHEDNSGKMIFHYAFASENKAFDPAKSTMLGYELNTPIETRKNWFSPAPPSEGYMSIDNNNLIIMNFKSIENGKVIRLINADNESVQTGKIISKLFNSISASETDLFGKAIKEIPVKNNEISVSLKPGEFKDILIKINNK